MYEFAWRSPKFEGKLGACHALEIPFVFDTLDKEGYEELMGTEPPQQLADAMHAAWVAFATSGNPGLAAVRSKSRATMHFDTTSTLVEILDPPSACCGRDCVSLHWRFPLHMGSNELGGTRLPSSL